MIKTIRVLIIDASACACASRIEFLSLHGRNDTEYMLHRLPTWGRTYNSSRWGRGKDGLACATIYFVQLISMRVCNIAVQASQPGSLLVLMAGWLAGATERVIGLCNLSWGLGIVSAWTIPLCGCAIGCRTGEQ